MIATAAWIFAGIALWFTRGTLDVFDAAGRTTRVAMLPSAPELLGLIVLSLSIAAGVAASTKRWSKSSDDRAEAFLQVSLPLFSLALVIVPYLPWLPDTVAPLRALAGPMAGIIWFVVVGQVTLTFLDVRASLRGRPLREGRHVFGTIAILLLTAAISGATAIRFRDTLTGVALSGTQTFSIAGYHPSVWASIALTALTALLMWRWIVAFTGSSAAATFAWAAVFLGAPVLFTSVSTYPDIPAALCVMVALAWRSDPARTRVSWHEYLVRGLAVSALPWLATAYTPMAAALMIVLGVRAVQNSRAVLALLVPFSVSLIRWFEFYHAQPLGNPGIGILGLLVDQEFGALGYSPALALGFVGLWQLMTAGRGSAGAWWGPATKDVRHYGRELALVFGALLVSMGAIVMWWGGTAPPGRPLVAALPLLGFPIAWAYLDAPAGSVRRAVYQLLVLIGVAISLAMLLTEHGALVVQDLDGSSRLLQWVTTLWPAWQVAPAVAAGGLTNSLGVIGLWLVAALTVAWMCRRNSLQQPGASALMATVNLSAAIVVVALISPAVARIEPASVTEPQARSRLPILDTFDSLARPHAIIYRPFAVVHSADIPPLMTLAATPGMRTGDQPIRVLLDARYALAAGDYQVQIGGLHNSAAVQGTLGLQVGRIGSPFREWAVNIAPNGTWDARFSLPVDAEFVGFVASDSLSAATSLRITPLTIIDKNNRESSFHGPSRIVLSAVGFPSASVFFHDEDVYPERTGFWVHGESTSYMTVASNHPDQDVTLRVHSGAAANTVTFATTTWGERVALTPGSERDVHIPAPARPGPFLLRVTTDRGFVPAEVLPGNTDRRMLGCWIEIAH
jgi:hypothetical protein